MGILPTTKMKDLVNGNVTATNPGIKLVTSNPPGGVINNQGTGDVAGSTTTNSPLTHDVVNYTPVSLLPSTVDYGSLFPDAIINVGLNNTPWYKDTGLVTGNPKVRGVVTPVVFEVILHDRQDVYLPQVSPGATSIQGAPPLQVQLNASMKTFSVSSKHVCHPQRTRVGWHVTMWGMQADTIEGSCTTGVFMNQLGLTDFFSTATISQDIISAVTAGFQTLASNQSFSPLAFGQETATNAEQGASPDMISEVYGGESLSAQSYLSKLTQSPKPQDMFRVAAQDAFVEFLSLFKMNGIRWFYEKAEQEAGSGQVSEQVGIDAWSPELGISATQMNGRTNDVMSRGAILMKFKGVNYLGYFKSLSWAQDAATPFKWEFNFVFQVEKTLGFIFNPAG
jgi:hypothetical protein